MKLLDKIKSYKMTSKKRTKKKEEENKEKLKTKKKSRRIFKSKRERRREKENRDENFEMFRGWFGDRDYRTRQGLVNAFLVLSATIILGFGVFLSVTGFAKYQSHLANNTTPIGDDLQFRKSEATLKFGGAWTDKNRDVTVVKLKYTKQARDILSTQGKQYKIFIVDNDNKVQKNIKMAYGMLGTKGDGFLFINGKLDEKAYQVILTNQLDVIDDSDSDDSSASESAKIARKADRLTQTEIEESLSKTRRSDVDDDGRIDFGKNSRKPNVDYIDFRVNTYSDTTKVVKDSFLTSDGNIDYAKVLDKTTVEDVINNVVSEIQASEARLENHKERISEFEDRVKQNKDDKDAQANIDSLERKVEDEKENLEQLEKLKETYENGNFDKSSFGNMQEDFKMIHSVD